MATQKAQTTGFLPGSDPEILEANQRYQDALNKLTQSLDTRKNRLFDPVWLAAAQGFLTPGTPDFFESLGKVAKNVGEAQAAQAKEDRDIAQLELDVAGRGLEMQRQRSRDAMARRYLVGEGEFADAPRSSVGALPAASGASSGTAQGALAQAATRGAAPSQDMGFQIAPPVPGISRDQFVVLGLSEGKSPSEIAKEWEVIQRGRQQVKEGFMVDTGTGRAYSFPTGRTEEVQIFSRDGTAQTYKVPANIAAQLSEYVRTGDSENYFALAEKVKRGPGGQAPAIQGAAAPQGPAVQPPQPAAVRAPSAPLTAPAVPSPAAVAPAAVAPSVAPGSSPASPAPIPPVGAARPTAPASSAAQAAPAAVQAAAQAAPAAVPPAAPAAARAGLRSQEDIEAEKRRIEIEQATAKARAEADVKSEIEAKAEISANAKKAREITATANVLRRMADAPDFSKMTGILNNEKISSGLAMLVRDGIGGKSFSIGVPAIEDVMRNAGLNPAQQARYRTFLMYTAQMNLAAENSMKGSTTERERLILGNATISPQDTKETVRVKADILNLKAKFDRRVSNAFEDSKMTPKDFFRSEAYETMYGDYLEKLMSIAAGEKMTASPGQQTRPAAGPQGVSRARDTLNNLLNRRP
jgi:hypothetical protein